MRILHVRGDPDYASAVVDDSVSSSIFTSLQADKIEDFKPPLLHLAEHDQALGNFMHISDNALLFDEKSSDVFGDFIEAAGQIFRINVEGAGAWCLLNVLETCNPVDKQHSIADPDDWRDTLNNKSLKFHKDRVFSFSSLFKIPELHYIPILTFNGHDEHEHDFYAVYKEHNLTGLKFDEIWSSEG